MLIYVARWVKLASIQLFCFMFIKNEQIKFNYRYNKYHVANTLRRQNIVSTYLQLLSIIPLFIAHWMYLNIYCFAIYYVLYRVEVFKSHIIRPWIGYDVIITYWIIFGRTTFHGSAMLLTVEPLEVSNMLNPNFTVLSLSYVNLLLFIWI